MRKQRAMHAETGVYDMHGMVNQDPQANNMNCQRAKHAKTDMEKAK